MTTVNSTPATDLCTEINSVDMSSASYINSFRISAVCDRLSMHVCAQSQPDPTEFLHLCLSLSRGIDFALANLEVPTRARELPLLVKQVCRRYSDPYQLAPIMVLMISIKNACRSKWFLEKDAEELCNLANEISSHFCSDLDFKTEPSNSQTIISTIMSRFYPRLRIGQIVSFLEVKHGYGTFLNDFPITKNIKLSEGEKVRLFVAQIDNLETSQCLVTPPQVSFLLNGVGVGRRTSSSMDLAPQLPTPVPHMLKFGTNLLQASGYFNGNYIIAVAFMSEISAPIPATLPDYEQPPASSVDPDSEIIEGPSRISLNCPISFKRIKTPVKGRTCKHLQCFDFDNYVGINSRRPSWRCPHCNQYVCFTEIHIDQDMVKILKEVGEDVSDVMISSDGSWKAIMESDDDHTEKPRDKTPDDAQDNSPQLGSEGLSSYFFDLTAVDDEMNVTDTDEPEDCKNTPTITRIQSNIQNATAANASTAPPQTGSAGVSSMGDDFWSRMYLSSIGSGTNLELSPALNTDGNALIPTSVLQSGLSSSPNMLRLQQFQFGDSGVSNEYGRFPSVGRPANRTPVAVQALPAQSTMSPLSRTAPTQDFPERQRYPTLDSSPLPQQISTQRTLAPHLQSSVGRQTPNVRTPHSMSPSQGLTQSSRQPFHPGSSQVGVTRVTQQARGVATQQTTQAVRPVQSPRTPSPLPGNAAADGFRTPLVRDQRSTTPLTASELDPNWRPTGRMRGSLSGQAYSEALQQFILQPSQQSQAARPSVPANLPPQLQVLLANRGVSQSTNGPDGSAALPDRSSGK